MQTQMSIAAGLGIIFLVVLAICLIAGVVLLCRRHILAGLILLGFVGMTALTMVGWTTTRRGAVVSMATTPGAGGIVYNTSPRGTPTPQSRSPRPPASSWVPSPPAPSEPHAEAQQVAGPSERCQDGPDVLADPHPDQRRSDHREARGSGYDRSDTGLSERPRSEYDRSSNGEPTPDWRQQDRREAAGSVWNLTWLGESDRTQLAVVTHRRSSWLLRILALCAVGGFLLVGYLFLDSATRGQFTWKVRIAAALAFAGICILLLEIR